jgi:hypothetical protein
LTHGISDGRIYPTGVYSNSWQIETAMVSDQHLPDKDPVFPATTNLLPNDGRNPKRKIYLINAACCCSEHTPICVTDSTEQLVMQESSFIPDNMKTFELSQSHLYDLVSVHNTITVCYSLATCQEQNKPH